jgi:hypothetical protein
MANAAPMKGAALDANGEDIDNPSHTASTGRSSTHLIEPIKVAEFWKNRRGDTIRITLENYEGHDLVSIRQFFTTADNKLAPTKKGVSIAVSRLPDLEAAVTKALNKARELGLIDGAAK